MHMAFLSRVFKNLQWYGMTKSIENFGFRCFFCCKNAENGASQNVGQLPDPHRDPHAEMRGKGERVPERRLCPLSDISYVLFLLTSLVP